MTEHGEAEVEIVADTTKWDAAFAPRVRTLGPGELIFGDGSRVPMLGGSITEPPSWILVDAGALQLPVPNPEAVGAMWDHVVAAVTPAIERITEVFTDMTRAFGTLTVTLRHVNPDLWRLLFKPRRGWKGHGAPPLFVHDHGRPWTYRSLPARGRPRKTDRRYHR